MIQSEATNRHIEQCALEVLAKLGRPDERLTVWQTGFEVPEKSSGEFGPNDLAGTWELRLTNGNVYSLSLTFKQTYDSEELKGVIGKAVN